MESLGFIKKLLKKTGPRPSCSESEKKAAGLISRELKKYCDEVKTEGFFACPSENLFWMAVSSFLLFFSLITFFTMPVLSFILFSLSCLNFILDGILGLKIYSPFFKRKESQNVIGIRYPENKKQDKKNRTNTIIFSAHHDSGFISPLFSRPIFAMACIKAGILFSLIASFAALLNVLSYLPWFLVFQSYRLVYFFMFLIYFLLLIFITLRIRDINAFSPGANDNLSAVALIIEIAKRSRRLRNTKLVFISFGCEEISAVGSEEYVKRHLTELKNENAICINFDAIGCPGEFAFMDIERLGFARYDEKTKTEFRTHILNSDGTVAKGSVRLFGITDGGSFINKGIKAVSIIGVDKSSRLIPYWHQKSDIADKIYPRNIDVLCNSCLSYLESADKK